MAITLTAPLLRSLRTADGVIFRHSHGIDSLELIFGSFGANNESKLTIEDAETRTSTLEYGPFESAFSYLQSAKFHTEWQTVAKSLRVGDRVRLMWHPDYHSNGYVRMVGLHADSLLLGVIRGEGRNAKTLQFHVDQSLTPDNSARMIQGCTRVDRHATPCVMTDSWDDLQLRAERLERVAAAESVS
jgi:hypothetical protein